MPPRPAALLLTCALWQSAPANAEANWADLFPLMGNVILFGLPIEIAQFCYHVWPLMAGLAALSWIIRALIIRMEDVRSGALERPERPRVPALLVLFHQSGVEQRSAVRFKRLGDRSVQIEFGPASGADCNRNGAVVIALQF